MSAKVTEVPASKNTVGPGYSVKGSEELRYTYSFVDNVFDQQKEDLASFYTKWGRVLVVVDDQVHSIYGKAIETYFGAHNIPVTFHIFKGGELNKNMDTFEGMVDAFDQFGLIRKVSIRRAELNGAECSCTRAEQTLTASFALFFALAPPSFAFLSCLPSLCSSPLLSFSFCRLAGARLGSRWRSRLGRLRLRLRLVPKVHQLD